MSLILEDEQKRSISVHPGWFRRGVMHPKRPRAFAAPLMRVDNPVSEELTFDEHAFSRVALLTSDECAFLLISAVERRGRGILILDLGLAEVQKWLALHEGIGASVLCESEDGKVRILDVNIDADVRKRISEFEDVRPMQPSELPPVMMKMFDFAEELSAVDEGLMKLKPGVPLAVSLYVQLM